MNIKCIYSRYSCCFSLIFYSSILSSPMNMNSYTFLCQTYEQVRVLDKVNISIGFFFRMQTPPCYQNRDDTSQFLTLDLYYRYHCQSFNNTQMSCIFLSNYFLYFFNNTDNKFQEKNPSRHYLISISILNDRYFQ